MLRSRFSVKTEIAASYVTMKLKGPDVLPVSEKVLLL